jgi:hypothetical protein
VPWLKAGVATAPFLLSIVATTVIPSIALSAALLMLGAGAMFALFFLYVPLEHR